MFAEKLIKIVMVITISQLSFNAASSISANAGHPIYTVYKGVKYVWNGTKWIRLYGKGRQAYERTQREKRKLQRRKIQVNRCKRKCSNRLNTRIKKCYSFARRRYFSARRKGYKGYKLYIRLKNGHKYLAKCKGRTGVKYYYCANRC